MYRWYKNAYICYPYLSDVSAKRVVRDSTSYRSLYRLEQFGMARYFSRGWTLQELIAPSIVEFYDVDWTEIGTKSSLREVLSRHRDEHWTSDRRTKLGPRLWCRRHRDGLPRRRAVDALGPQRPVTGLPLVPEPTLRHPVLRGQR